MRSLAGWSIAFVAIVATLAATEVSHAQSPSATELSAARELFETGLRAAREERWTEARTAFERSLAIAPLATTRLNLAGAQVQSGQLVAGAESYRTFLAEATSGRAARYRAEAESALADVEARTPRARVEIVGLTSADVLLLDGRPLSRATLSVALRVDPGEHVIVVRRAGRSRAETRFTIGEREQRSVRIDARERARAQGEAAVTRARPVRPAARTVRPIESPTDRADLDDADREAEPSDDRGGGGSVLASPWLWIGVGIAVVGGVTAAVVVGASSAEPDLYRGTLGPGRVTFE